MGSLIQRKKKIMMMLQMHGDGNLFNLNVPFQNPDNTSIYDTEKRIFTPGTYCVGASYSNWFQPYRISNYSISGNTLTITTNGAYGIGFPIKVKNGESYKLSYDGSTNAIAASCGYLQDGTAVPGYSGMNSGHVINIATGVDILLLVFTSTQTDATFTNIRLEKI